MKAFFLLLLFSFPAFAYDELCPSVRIKKVKKLKLNDNEKRLLCGDPKEKAYESIPAYQAEYFLKGFLQSRGYLRPELKIDNGVLFADIGKISKVRKIYVQPEDHKKKDHVQYELRQLYKRRILTTGTLNSIEADALGIFRNSGYPCTKIKSVADIDKSFVHIDGTNLTEQEFGEVEKEQIPGLQENALDRFYPFVANDKFNADLLKLTEKRMVRTEVVQGTYFLENCEGENFSMKQEFIIGPPRTLRYGIGASTELGPMARVRWSNNRYKSMASLLSATLQASLRSQSLNLTADSYFWKNSPRRSVLTQAEIIREDQLDYEQLIYRFKPAMKWTRDSEGFSKLYTLGPTYEGGTFFSVENSDTRSFSSGTIEGTAQWMSHKYEMFDVLPADGNLFTANFDFRHPATGFEEPLLKLDTSATHIDRLSNWGRGALIGAVKFHLGSTMVDTDEISLTSLPPTVKFFGGGSEDLRGFFLRTLPKNDGAGALTRALAKFELRKTYLFKESLEAFTFFDIGSFSEKQMTVGDDVYYSPGIGIRWISPIGLVQGYAARAYQSEPYKDHGNFFFFGIGGSF